jgi:hypothetical protein
MVRASSAMLEMRDSRTSLESQPGHRDPGVLKNAGKGRIQNMNDRTLAPAKKLASTMMLNFMLEAIKSAIPDYP